MTFDLNGQLAIVTGGTRGIGLAITERFLAAGAEVVAIYASDDAAAAKLHGRERVTTAKVDISDPAAVEAFYKTLPRTPAVLVNNAGIKKDQILGMLRYEDWRRVLAVNLDGTFLMSKHAVLAMVREKYGRIISIISPAAKIGMEGTAAYSASKAGQEALARTLAKEVATRGITVNCIEPGFIATELIADLEPEKRAAYEKMVPLRRFGETREVADAVLFLASKEASYVTGATLRVAGGM